jgi:hypothetical protein
MKLLAPDVEQTVPIGTDLFGREAFAAGLLNLFGSSRDSLVLALDEEWGAGKTVFAKRLQRRAESEGFPTVYFDAFARDYEPDVFLALASTALHLLPKGETKRVRLREKAKTVGKVLGRVAFKGAVRVATAGTIQAADISDAHEQVATEVSDLVEAELDSLIEHRLSHAKQEEEAFKKFRLALSSISQSASGEAGARPVVFIVDELDRCRPDYALSVLETIKHFFSAPNVHFLLLCQLSQLAASITTRYGLEIDADSYLEKFIHARVSFPIPKAHERRDQIGRFVRDIMKLMPDDGDDGKLKSGMADFLVDTAIRKNYSLRRIERVLTQFGLCMAFSKANWLRLGAVVYVLCDLKQTNRLLFQKAKIGTLTYKEIRDFYDFDDEAHSWFIQWLRFFYDKSINFEEEEWRSLSRSLYRYNVDRPADTALFFANKVVDSISA